MASGGRSPKGLQTGLPQNEAKTGDDDLFATLYAEPERLRGFLKAMTGVSIGAAHAIAAAFPWDRHETMVDIGCAEGCLPVHVALAQRASDRRRVRPAGGAAASSRPTRRRPG